MSKAKSKKTLKPKPRAKSKPKLESKRTANAFSPRKRADEALSKALETAVAPWQFLVRRLHPWRKQLYVKGRNLTARQLVGSIKANQLDEEKAAQNHHLPIEAVREALAY